MKGNWQSPLDSRSSADDDTFSVTSFKDMTGPLFKRFKSREYPELPELLNARAVLGTLSIGLPGRALEV
jgi:hypothetical protein